jgi:hypothetical protein
MNTRVSDAEASTVIIARVTEPQSTHVARHSLEDVMAARALIADQQAAKEQAR